MEDDPVSIPPPIPSNDAKMWVVLCHLSLIFGLAIVFPLIVYLVKKNDDPWTADQAREVLNFHLSIALYIVLCVPLVFICVGPLIAFLIGVCAVLVSIVAAVDAAKHQTFRYPLTIRFVK